MFTQETSPATILTGAVSTALLFTPFFFSFSQVAAGLSVGLLLLAVATGIHDTWWVPQGSIQAPKAHEATTQPFPFRKAA